MSRMSLLTRTDQKFLSFAFSSLWKLRPGPAGFIWKSNAVVLTAFCSSPVSRARLSVKVSAIRNSTAMSWHWPHCHSLRCEIIRSFLDLLEAELGELCRESIGEFY